MKITSPDKIMFSTGITKLDIVNYYREIAKYMMPYIGGRILSLVRCPQGVEQPCFYKKNPDNNEQYYIINTVDELIEQVQLNTIEFHTWGTQINNLDCPDIMIFDIDPGPEVRIEAIRQAAKDIQVTLKALRLESFVKTSGNNGYHIVVPFSKTPSWEVFRDFAKNVADLLEAKHPEKYTTNIRKSARASKIFIDWLRNTKGATSVAPYSLRIKTPSISAPISWQELDKIAPNQITMATAIKRAKKKDLWHNFFEIKATQFLK